MFRLRQFATVLPAIVLCFCIVGRAQTAVTKSSGDSATVREAAEAITAGNWQKADTDLQAVLQTSPDDIRALNLMGIVRAQQQNNVEAQRFFRRAIALKPDFASAHMGLGMLCVQMSKPDDAVREFQEVLRIDSARADAQAALLNILRDEAHEAVQQNDPEKALSFLLQARKTSPKDPDVAYDFGMVALRMSLFPDAMQAFQDTLSVRKDDGHALYGLGRAHMGLSKYEDARATFERYVQLHPEDASGHYALGMTLEALAKVPEARAEFEKSIELQPAQTESFFRMGVMDVEANDFGAARRELEQVLRRDPHHTGAMIAMGRLKFQQKDYASAAELLQKAIAGDSSMREAHYYLGLTYARTGRQEDSTKELQIASHLEQEELAHQRTVFKIVDQDESTAGETKK